MVRPFKLLPFPWGKWCDLQNCHPLLCHLVDVGGTTAELLKKLPLRLWGHIFGDLTPGRRSQVIALAAFHDLGKAAPGFQAHPGFSRTEVEIVLQRLDAAGLPCPTSKVRILHGTTTALVVRDFLPRFGFDPESAKVFARIIGGHHGAFPTSSDLNDAKMYPDLIGEGPWHEVRAAIVDHLARLFPIPSDRPMPIPDSPAAVVIAGLVSVADWIGSMEDYFPYAISAGLDPAMINLEEYAAKSRERAERALHELRWTSAEAPSSLRDFSAIFRDFAPNGLQRVASDIAHSLDFPALVLIEAPMGEGKTEAAMYLAEAAAASLKHPACYFALPTEATSNQMFTRVREFLEATAGGEINLQLLHGHASLSAEFELLRTRARMPIPSANAQDEPDGGESARVFAAEWFTYRKRGLLAPYGVGTIDQALLAVLKTRHFFVRMFGLAGKTVIIDEVHAYDAYMSTLLERLLEWLAALGAPVILLSATLPASRRNALVRAYTDGLGISASLPSPELYPRITWASARGCGSRSVSTSGRSRRDLALHTLDAERVAEQLSILLRNGGCAAVVCNTVGRAQQVFTSLKPFFREIADDGESELMLFHARYPFEERDWREKLALARFGKPGAWIDAQGGGRREVKRPKRAVLVATQVIEQSLDLDFDVMVTDFAPIDLLLQRAGRIHRHERAARPAGIDAPALFVIAPAIDQNEIPAFDSGTDAIYHPHLLLRSWLALRGRDSISIPNQVETLIESVYRDSAQSPAGCSDALRAHWKTTADSLDEKIDKLGFIAKQNRIPRPREDVDALLECQADLEEDQPEKHASLQALTRVSELPSVDVVVLEADTVFDPDATPDREQAVRYLRRSLKIAHAVTRELIKDESIRPKGWRRSALLRHHRIISLDANGRKTIGKFVLSLDRELGIVIESVIDRRDRLTPGVRL